jgi:tRNA(fMet)-specific endonuclease VapC
VTEPEQRQDRGILDTNAVLLADRLSAAELPQIALITTITLAELSVGPLATNSPEERARRQIRLQEAEATFEAIPFDSAAARAYGQVATSLRHAGRKTTARAFDALIAATALAHELPVYTCNPRDFAGIDGLDVRPLTHPDSL